MDANAQYAGGKGWNREHVWAKSRGDFGTKIGAGTDLHHLRAEDVSTNSARNNRSFDDNKDFSDIEVQINGISGLGYQISNLSTAHTYFWRVKAVNSSGSSNWTIPRVFSTPGQIPSFSNTCPDGYFWDPISESCVQLDKSFGFSQSTFNQNVGDFIYFLDQSNCNEISFRNALETLGSPDIDGGTLVLPECDISFSNQVYIPSNTIIQGQGIGLTNIIVTGWTTTSENFFRIEKDGNISRPEVENVIIRDLTIQNTVTSKNFSLILISDSQNILLEQIKVLKAHNKNNIHLSHSQFITIRYCSSSEAQSVDAGHGIGIKDCENPITKANCEDGPNFWSSNIEIYSDSLFFNEGHGLDSHASDIEIAGNFIYANTYGTKFPEISKNLWIHHNVIMNNNYWGVKSMTDFCSYSDENLQSKNHVYYLNKIDMNGDNGTQNGTYGVVVKSTENVYFINNISYYGNKANNKCKIEDYCNSSMPSSVYYCQEDPIGESIYDTDSVLPVLISDDRCNLNNIANIFNTY